VLTALASPSPSHAEAGRDETERWVPSVAVFGGIIGQTASGDVISGLVCPDPTVPCPPLPPIPLALTINQPIRPPDGPNGVPTVVAGEDTLLALAPTMGLFNLPEQVVTGQGSRTRAEIQPFVLSAGLGVAFTLDIGHRRIRIKPSVEYLRETLDITGIVNRAVKITNPARPQDGLDSFRLISLTSSTTEVYHGVGPGLEFEADALRAGPFMLSLFVAGQAYSIFGDRDIELSDTNEFGETAEWRFQKEKWGWGARAGLRFRWLPE
jgi:hypothetical protein